jgi:hypothetical protein
MEPSGEPSAASARGRSALPAADGPSSGRAGKFFYALGPAWRLTAAQRSRLTPAVLAALDEGWSPQQLARFAGANTDGVRNPYAVLAVRLSAAELPPPPGQRPPRPPWCGECDERTRMAGFYSDAPNPCPRCNPTACTRQDSSSPDSPHRLHRDPAQRANTRAWATGRSAQPAHHKDPPSAIFDPDPVCARR